jgi:hypothetical protein
MTAEAKGDQPGFSERLAEIRERLEGLLQRIDLREQIEAHPWELVGAAALLGAWVGFEPPRVRVREPSKVRTRIADALLTAVGALTIRLAREAAFRQVADIAKRWWDESGSSEVGADSKPETRTENGRSDSSHARRV